MAFALATAAITAGAAVYSANQQSKAGAAQENAQRLGAAQRLNVEDYNFAARQDNLDAQLLADRGSIALAGIENALARKQTAVNFLLADREAQIREDNAIRLRQQAGTVESQGRESVVRMRNEQEEVTGAQIASVAANGLELSGSPMEAVAKSAGEMQLYAEESWYQSTQEARALRDQADTLDYTAGLVRAQATFDQNIGNAAADVQSGTNRLSLLTSQSNYRQGQQAAEIARLQGYSDATGQGYQADATRAQTRANVNSTYMNAAATVGTTYIGMNPGRGSTYSAIS